MTDHAEDNDSIYAVMQILANLAAKAIQRSW